MLLPPIPTSNYVQLLAAQLVAKDVKPYRPVAVRTGAETWFEGRGMVVCDTASKWSEVWDHHLKNESLGNTGVIRNLTPAPDVDFDTNLVVALFAGPTPGIVGYRVVGGLLVGKQATLRVVPIPTNEPKRSIAVPTPWAFLVLPRTAATVKIQVLGSGGWETVGSVKPSL